MFVKPPNLPYAGRFASAMVCRRHLQDLDAHAARRTRQAHEAARGSTATNSSPTCSGSSWKAPTPPPRPMTAPPSRARSLLEKVVRGSEQVPVGLFGQQLNCGHGQTPSGLTATSDAVSNR